MSYCESTLAVCDFAVEDAKRWMEPTLETRRSSVDDSSHPYLREPDFNVVLKEKKEVDQ